LINTLAVCKLSEDRNHELKVGIVAYILVAYFMFQFENADIGQQNCER